MGTTRLRLKRARPRMTRLLIITCSVLVLAQGFLTAVTYVRSQQRISKQVAEKFEELSTDYADSLLDHVENYSSALHSTKALFAAAKVDANSWKSFVRAQSTPNRYPGMKALAYAEIVPSERLGEFERTLQTTQHPGITIRPNKESREHIILTYHEDVAQSNAKLNGAVGFDLASDAERTAALKKAHQTGDMTASASVSLVTNNEAGFLLILPLTEKFGSSASDPPVFGFGIAAFDFSALIKNTIGPRLERYKVSLSIQDVTDGGSAPLFAKPIASEDQTLVRDVTTRVADRTWMLTFQMPRGELLVDAQRLAPFAIIAVGIGFMLATSILANTLRLRFKLKSFGW